MILNLLFSMKGLSLTSMLFMIAINPQNAIKISFSHFAFNLSMALVSFIFPFYMKTLIEVSLPYKGSLVGVFFFTFFKNVPKPILLTYEWLVYLICPFYGIFEVLQLVNMIFMFSRYFQKKIDFQKPFYTQLSSMVILVTSIVSIIYSLFLVKEMFFEDSYVSSLSKMVILGSGFILIIALNSICFIAEYEDAIISNSALISLYLTLCLRTFWQTLNTIEKNKIIQMNQPPQTFESGLFELWTSIMQWQKRGSQYLTSFILGNGGYNIDGFSESMLNATGFITTFKIVVLFMTLPMTYQEWPWVEKGNQNDQQNQQNQVNLQNNAQPQQQQQRSIQEAEEYNARLAHASTYLMNALFVLMTTNYTVNPQLYYLGDGATDKNSSFMIYFPLFQIVIGILYTVEKVMSSSD
eukprot:403370857